jgi:MFS family permease
MGDHPAVIRLSVALFLVQAGFHGFTASIPLALSRAGRPDAEIGAIVGLAPLIQIGAALVGGALIDRFGGIRLFLVGALLYIGACGLLFFATPGPEGAVFLVAARLLQGAGFGFAMPAAMSVIPRVVSTERRGTALATAGAAHNLTFVALPPLSIAVLDAAGFDAVTVMVAALVGAGMALTVSRPIRFAASAESHLGAAKRRFGFAYRRSWLAPLIVTVLFVVHWGVVTAYLPQRAEAAGANIGLFFVADGLFVLLARVPAGWLADRMRPITLVLGGLGLTALGVLLLLPTPTTEILFVSGALTGVGAAVIIIPIMLALTERSTDADRGSAFALFNATFAGAIALGSIGTAPLIGSLGFEALLALGIGALGASAAVALADRGMRTSGPPSPTSEERALERAEEAGASIGP